MTAAPPPRVCPVCDLVPVRTFRLSNGARLLRCPRCRLGWWSWPEFDPSAFYDRDYFQSAGQSKGYNDYASTEPAARHTARRRLRRLAGLLHSRSAAGHPQRDRARRLLDIGCGPGCFLEEARRAGWNVAGIEVSEYAAHQARRRGLDVIRWPAEQPGPSTEEYGCVTLWDTIEHLRDPVRVLSHAAGALRPGGLLALSTGDITSLCARLCGPRWHLFNLPEHLFFFSPQSLRALLARTGFRVLRIVREVNWIPLAYAAERLGKAALGRAAPRNWVVPATLFDVLGVYAQRRAARGRACLER